MSRIYRAKPIRAIARDSRDREDGRIYRAYRAEARKSNSRDRNMGFSGKTCYRAIARGLILGEIISIDVGVLTNAFGATPVVLVVVLQSCLKCLNQHSAY
jgi:hypothetical protein